MQPRNYCRGILLSYVITVPERYRQTDGRTDGRTDRRHTVA